jgi:cell division protein FtsW (lipid II flippase)
MTCVFLFVAFSLLVMVHLADRRLADLHVIIFFFFIRNLRFVAASLPANQARKAERWT